MSFYKSIATYYDAIFPLEVKQVDLIRQNNPKLHEYQLLDIGCGTGNLTLELSKFANKVDGIDLDTEMLNVAVDKRREQKVRFFDCNMLNFSCEIDSSYDLMLSFGNTLVHLDTLDDIDGFLNQCNSRLNENGKLYIQIINYDRILKCRIDHLPTIDNDTVTFERNYQYAEKVNKVDFETILTVKQTGETMRNHQQLYPITQNQLLALLQKNNFEVLNQYGDFEKYAFDADTSLHLIIEARKL